REGVTTLLMTFGIGAVVGNLAGGVLADRFGWRATLTALCIGQMVLMPLFSALPVPDIALLVLAFTWSAVGWAFMSAQQMRLIGIAGPQAPVALALNAASIYVGAALGSAFGAWVIQTYGIQAIGIAAGAAAGLALIHITLSALWPPNPR
ncbi:MAG: MFS transporter, partial [Rhodobacteraceae bacterium]|nr:MFS transporter [Paracoccaceae bacterium]